ncbi:3868_t:CDS:2 [Acaulospora colombiana]|uniref:3868_t:CDS:1 n=1 Tax=Acaulospora colombiana TaxID=27376 RepID=A0ACA9MEX3_9GLOM|nr:3868_t:CDS:2 [Acaulospora colombiana]
MERLKPASTRSNYDGGMPRYAKTKLISDLVSKFDFTSYTRLAKDVSSGRMSTLLAVSGCLRLTHACHRAELQPLVTTSALFKPGLQLQCLRTRFIPLSPFQTSETMRSFFLASSIFTLVTFKNITWARAQFVDPAISCTLACIERHSANGCTPGERTPQTCPGWTSTTDSFRSTPAANWYCNTTLVPHDCEDNYIVQHHTVEEIRFCHMLLGDYTAPTPDPSQDSTTPMHGSILLPSPEWASAIMEPRQQTSLTQVSRSPLKGGSMSVQIDGAPASTLSTSSSGAGAARDQCAASPVFSSAQLESTTHQVIVKNGLAESESGAGTLELSAIT